MTDPLDITLREESRLRQAAFMTLFGLMGGHALLETARDALFLTHVSAERLPWVYLLIAVAAVGVARLQARSQSVAGHRQQLIALQGAAAVVTLGFWFLLPSAEPWLYYALYVWSGVIGSILIVIFWLVLGELFTITQGKRIYASIGTGGAAGAIAGFGLAAAFTAGLPAESLLPASALLFAASALGPLLSLRQPEQDTGAGEEATRSPDPRLDEDAQSLRSNLADILGHPYACRVALLVVLSAITLTLSDFLFKSVLSDVVPPELLASWLARIYLVLNLGSLLVLVFGVTRIIRRVSVHRAMAILPALLCVAAVGILLGGALLPVLFLKFADGTLRYSVQKTASELLYLPMPAELRGRIKGTIDIIGLRGANAISSGLILLALAIGPPTLLIAGGVLVLGVVWIALALKLRESYLDVFREALSEGTIETRVDVPELDLASLETLIRALNHSNDRHVLAALDLLEAKGRVELIPSLILYHPSSAVVARALDLLASSGRRDFVMLADRLLANDDAEIRAAMVRAMWSAEPDRDKLEALLDNECLCIRSSAAVGLLVNQWIEPEAAQQIIEETLQYHDPAARMALANAIKLHHLPEFRDPIRRLTRDSEPAVRREALRAIRASEDESYTPLLVQLLDDRDVREEVRNELRDRGDSALDELSRVLKSKGVPASLLRHIPRSISRFDNVRAAQILLEELGADHGPDGEPSDRHIGMVRYKILRGLAPLLEGSIGDRVDKSPLHISITRTINRVIQMLHWQIWLEAGREEDEARQTCGSYLLLQLLEDKERLALQRIFRMLYLIQPEENFRHIWVGLHSMSRTDRASSLELLENVLGADQRRRVVALVDSGARRERLRLTGSSLSDSPLDYTELLSQIGRDGSRSLHGLAMYHADEMGLKIEFEQLAIEPRAGGSRMSIREQALNLIEKLPESAYSLGVAAIGDV